MLTNKFKKQKKQDKKDYKDLEDIKMIKLHLKDFLQISQKQLMDMDNN